MKFLLGSTSSPIRVVKTSFEAIASSILTLSITLDSGKNKANILPTKNAFTMAINMAEHRKSTDGVVFSYNNGDLTNG